MTTPAVHVIVFSKDRPLQLHGYLTSLFAQWHGDFRVTGLVHPQPPFDRGYEDVIPEFKGRAKFWSEGGCDFASVLRGLLQDADAPLTVFGCDDAVFVAPVDADQLPPLFGANPKLLGISLRLGLTVKRGMWGHEMAQPRFQGRGHSIDRQTEDAALEWDCTGIGSAGDWAYPWDVVGTVYRTDFVRRMVENLAADGLAQNPSTLEHYGAQRWPQHAEGRTLLRAWHTPRLVLPTVNVVQSVFPNGTVGDSQLTPEFLLECWNRGLRLDTQRYATAPQPDTWRTGDLYLRRAA